MAVSKREVSRNQKRLLKSHQTAVPKNLRDYANESQNLNENETRQEPSLSDEDINLLLQSQGQPTLDQMPPEIAAEVRNQLSLQFQQSQNQTQSTGTSTDTSEDNPAELSGKYLTLKNELAMSIGGTFFPLQQLAKASKQPTLAADCKVLLEHSQGLSTRLAQVAKVYPPVYRYLSKASKIMPVIALAGELYAIGAAIAQNHGFAVPGLPATR